jgi:hypothetical protein
MRIVVSAACFCVAASCVPGPPSAPAPQAFADNFERDTLAPLQHVASFRILPVDTVFGGGRALCTIGDHNQTLAFENVVLGDNVRIDIDMWSTSPDVDMKLEVFGDGTHQSGYIIILGGWKNTVSVIARNDEHEPTRTENRAKLRANVRTHVTVERRGAVLTVLLDGIVWMTRTDARPLRGDRHNRLALSSWESDVCYDNLVVTPLP